MSARQHEYDVTPQEIEELEFVWMYSNDLNSAQHILRAILPSTAPDSKDKTVRYYLLLALVVTYATPFSLNRGTVVKKHRLTMDNVVPPELHYLHDRLMVYRDKQFAHTDVSHYNPRIANLGTIDNPRWGMSRRGEDFEFLDKNLDQIGRLVEIVKANVDARREEMLAYFNSRGVRPPST